MSPFPTVKNPYCSKPVYPKIFFFADLFWLLKITMDHHILVHVNIDCPDEGTQIKIFYLRIDYLDSYEYIAYVTVHGMIWPQLIVVRYVGRGNFLIS